MKTPERRQRRSRYPIEALRLYLKAFAGRRDHHTVGLADSCGRLVVGVGAHNPVPMAAAAPLAFTRPAAVSEALLSLITRGEAMHVWRVEYDEVEMFVAAAGGSEASPETLQEDVERIFAEHDLLRNATTERPVAAQPFFAEAG